MKPKRMITTLKSFVVDLLLWSLFLTGLAAGVVAGAVLDGTEKTVTTFAGVALSLVTGLRLAKKPRIKAFLSTRPVLWFLFLFNAGAAVVSGLTADGVKGVAAASAMGLVALGAAHGLVTGRRNTIDESPVPGTASSGR